MKKIFIVLLVVVAFLSCEKEVMYITVNIKSKDPTIKVYFGQNKVSTIDSSNYTGVSYMVSYDPAKNFYFQVESTDSLFIVGSIDIDTLFIESDYKSVCIYRKL